MSGTPVSPARILVVEDLEHNRELCRTLLVRAGYEVEVAANGAEGVAAVAAGRFDLVLIDIQMPVMDGLTAARAIRDLSEEGRALAIVGMSANTNPDRIQAFAAAGIDAPLRKPFRRAQLLEAIAPWLARAKPPDPPSALPEAEPALGDLLDLLGRDWVRTGLLGLKQQIDEAFAAVDPADAPGLARQAHALVSQAALLGFRDLSDRASALEEACLGERDVARAFAEARAAALAARRAIERHQDLEPGAR